MNRKIKFRAWDEIEKKMWWNVQDAYDSLCCHCQESPCDGTQHKDFHPSCFGHVLYDEDFIVMQFTGLKDKNGKEIYEGDIIAWPIRSISTQEIVSLAKHVVEWSSKRHHMTYGHGDFGEFCLAGFFFDGYLGLPEYSDIIGNIYENPELIK